jgi:hypothetical protein
MPKIVLPRLSGTSVPMPNCPTSGRQRALFAWEHRRKQKGERAAGFRETTGNHSEFPRVPIQAGPPGRLSANVSRRRIFLAPRMTQTRPPVGRRPGMPRRCSNYYVKCNCSDKCRQRQRQALLARSGSDKMMQGDATNRQARLLLWSRRCSQAAPQKTRSAPSRSRTVRGRFALEVVDRNKSVTTSSLVNVSIRLKEASVPRKT